MRRGFVRLLSTGRYPPTDGNIIVRKCYDNASEAGSPSGNAVFFLWTNNQASGVVTSLAQQRLHRAFAPFQTRKRQNQ
jgi:hypothetical protein